VSRDLVNVTRNGRRVVRVRQEAPAADPWERSVATLGEAERRKEVSARLKELNPGFSGRIDPHAPGFDLSIAGPEVRDISPLRAMPGLKALHIMAANPSDISPLRGTRLTKLDLWAGASDLSPLRGIGLRSLDLSGSKNVTDLSPLKGMPLGALTIAFTGVSDLRPLEGMQLHFLNCDSSKVTDLSPLKGARLKQLAIHNTKVTDLSPLKGTTLTSLRMEGSAVTDLSPLEGVPLESLSCNFDAPRDARVLRGIKTLSTINGKPAAEFWKGVDANTRD